ncbi:MAG: hypothetical protein WAU07_01215 [Microgenomates group bacterium]
MTNCRSNLEERVFSLSASLFLPINSQIGSTVPLHFVINRTLLAVSVLPLGININRCFWQKPVSGILFPQKAILPEVEQVTPGLDMRITRYDSMFLFLQASDE